MCKELKTEYPTKNKICLYYRDPVECLKSLMRSPLLKDHLDFTPRRLYENAQNLVRVYTEWLSGDAAWSMQVRFIFFFGVYTIYIYVVHRRDSLLVQLSLVLYYPPTKPIYQR
jgi:hypothetical protein